MSPREKGARLAARTALLSAIGVTLAFGLLVPVLSVDDSPSYLDPARAWAVGRGFGGMVERLPLYPFALGVAIWLFGEAPIIFSMLNVACHVGAVLVVRAVLPPGWRRDLVATAALVYPPLLTSTGLILQESLLSLAAAIVFALSWRLLERPTLARSVAAGTAIGVAALAKTTMLPVAILLALIVLPPLSGASLRRAAALLLVTAAVLLPWGLRNRRVLGYFAVTNGNGGLAMLGGTVSNNVLPSWYHFREYTEARARWERSERWRQPVLDRYLYEVALERIRSDPGRWLGLAVERAFRFMLPSRQWFFTSGLSRPASFGPWYVLAIGFQAVLFVSVLVVTWRALRERHLRPALAVAIVVLSHHAAHAISYASPRYAVAVGPVLFGALALALSNATVARPAKPPTSG